MIWVPPRSKGGREILGCTGKIKYPNQYAAVATLKKINNAGLSAYPCPNCGGWHLGNTPNKSGARMAQVNKANYLAWRWLEKQIRNAKGKDARRRDALERVAKEFSRVRDIFADAEGMLKRKRREAAIYAESGKNTRAVRRQEEIAVLKELFRAFPKGNRSVSVKN